MRSIYVVVVLFLVALFLECQHFAEAQLVFYIPFRLATGIFRPLRLLVTMGVLRRRLRFTRRLFQLMVGPMLLMRTEQNGINGGLDIQPRRLDSQEQNFFKSLSANDPNGCLFRLVCEVHATEHEHKLGSLEYDILEAFRYFEGESASNKTISNLPIFNAADLGRRSNNIHQCENRYKACPYNSQQIMMSFVKHEKSGQWPKQDSPKAIPDQNAPSNKPFTIKLNINLPGLFSG